ncbi:MAG TPA: hypothetical protein VK205_09895 [Prolixibacteraceae bacterium]|nr:hypothetical protein [Prolixibacteraceae bacterium]
MQKQIVLLASILVLAVSTVSGQKAAQDSTYRKFFIGSSFFILGNFIPDDPNPPDFIQLNFGYRISPKDAISLEAKTWRYAWPLGIPYGKSFEAPEEKYPGYIRDFGIGLVYQRFLWKGIYASIDAMNTLQRYVNEDNVKIQNGYQLFMTYRLGYHLELFKNRFFIEPSVAMTHWPVRTNVPESFAKLDNKWPNYFLFEPGLHFGINF